MPLSVVDDVRLQDLLAGDRSVVVDFYADWCHPCHALGPELEKLASRFADVDFVKVDVDAHPTIAVDLGIMGVPTVIRFAADGTEVARSVGAVRASELARRLDLS